jgi:putative flippase GtrA
MNSIKTLVRKFYASDVIRYLFFGVCTTLVNLVSFYLLRQVGVALNVANLCSIILAILFAYVVNSLFVFQDHCETLKDHIRPFTKFVGARLLTMVIEVGGVWLFVEKLGMRDMVGKCITQVVVIVLNYVFSKFLVFTTKKE